MFSGIYQIQSIIKPNRKYIGSAINFDGRKGLHLFLLRQNKHHSIKLQRHYTKYGENDLVFSILMFVNNENLINIEQDFINLINPYFNICPKANSRLGIVVSEKTRQKQRLAKLGIKHPVMKQDARDKLSIALMGNTNGKGNTGKVRSDEVKNKYRNATLSFFATEKGRLQIEKNRIKNTGVYPTPETLKKRSESLKASWAKKTHKIIQP
jgi:group I intron endonuclease